SVLKDLQPESGTSALPMRPLGAPMGAGRPFERGLQGSKPGSKRHGYNLPIGSGLRYHEKDIGPGAQTERRGDARPVSALLGGEDSPAALSLQSVLRSQPSAAKGPGPAGPLVSRGEPDNGGAFQASFAAQEGVSWPHRSRAWTRTSKSATCGKISTRISLTKSIVRFRRSSRIVTWCVPESAATSPSLKRSRKR